MSKPRSNCSDPDPTPAGPLMLGGQDATILADPGDEDRRPSLVGWLDLFAFTADNSRDLGDRMTRVLLADVEEDRAIDVEEQQAQQLEVAG
jgi:hypothetical protein